MKDTSINGGGALAHADDRTAALNQISWGAVFAGVVVALTVQLVLNLLGVGIGAAVVDPGTSDNPTAGAFSIAGGVWYLVAGLIGAFAGGYVSSRVSGRPVKTIGGLHGLTTWAATTLVILYLLTTSVGSLIGGAFGGLSSVIGGASGVASTAIQAAAPTVATMNPLQEIEAAAVQAVLTGDPAKAEEARARAADALARAQNISPDQARKQVSEYEARYRQTVEQAKQKAQDAAVTTTKIVSRGALLGFLALVLAAVAAWFGGATGTARAVRRI